MNNLKCRRWKNLIYKNNPEDDAIKRNLGNNPVSICWMVNIWINNPDTSWDDTICIENDAIIFMYDPYVETIENPSAGMLILKK